MIQYFVLRSLLLVYNMCIEHSILEIIPEPDTDNDYGMLYNGIQGGMKVDTVDGRINPELAKSKRNRAKIIQTFHLNA